MTKSDIFPAWGRILRGYRPLLSIEITKECPLRCPGCYAYEPEHLNGTALLRQLSDYRGQQLVDGVLALVRRYRPLHVSIVGGEPLVRYRELDALLPKLGDRRVEVQLVTSAVRPIPEKWAVMRHLHLVVSIDGLQPEHDRRRTPATYDRILQHIAGHRIIVHCTVTRQMLSRPEYLGDFTKFWSDRPEVRKIWFSLFTPQHGQVLEERLTSADRARAVDHPQHAFVIDLESAVLQLAGNSAVSVRRRLQRDLLHFVAQLHLYRDGLAWNPPSIEACPAQAGHLAQCVHRFAFGCRLPDFFKQASTPLTTPAG
jgi:organic radical activating enzyme